MIELIHLIAVLQLKPAITMRFLRRKPAMSQLALLPAKTEQVLLLIDWENLFYSVLTMFGVDKMHLRRRIGALQEWLSGIGGLLGGHGFVFAPEHLSGIHQNICTEMGLRIMTCPKRQLSKSEPNPKTGELQDRVDTVDETIMDFAMSFVGHPHFKTICLVSGDNDYVPLLETLRKQGVKIALAPPTVDSLARDKQLLRLADQNPLTGEKMIFMLDKVAV